MILEHRKVNESLISHLEIETDVTSWGLNRSRFIMMTCGPGEAIEVYRPSLVNSKLRLF